MKQQNQSNIPAWQSIDDNSEVFLSERLGYAMRGFIVKVSPDEADLIGAFQEDALDLDDALNSQMDDLDPFIQE